MDVQTIAETIIKTFENKHLVFLCGNGGSLDLANHMEEEFICKFEHERQPLPAIALKIHSSTSNDYGYEDVFARQIQALGKPNDLLITFSTSGNSLNVIKAQTVAQLRGLTVIEFPREGNSTAEIQQFQLKLMHDVCRIVEKEFLDN